jgi:prepilin-type N-terminal cleavage/methylation domain-containing protein
MINSSHVKVWGFFIWTIVYRLTRRSEALFFVIFFVIEIIKVMYYHFNMGKKGFTLIEVVVVVIIVGVLAGIAATGYIEQRRRAEYNGAQSIVRSIAAAVKNQFYVTTTVTLTGNTMATNNQYGLAIPTSNQNFYDYRVVAGAPFVVQVSYAPRRSFGSTANACTFTFDSNGTKTGCAPAANCF